jgi:hypothetical protein
VLLILVVMGYEFGSSSSDMFIELKLLSKVILVSVVTLFLLNIIYQSIYMLGSLELRMILLAAPQKVVGYTLLYLACI